MNTTDPLTRPAANPSQPMGEGAATTDPRPPTPDRGAAQGELLPPEPERINWLVGELHRAHGWLFAGELCRRCALEETEEHKRVLRRLASSSPLIVAGQKGYKHIEWATAEEVDHCCKALLSQARELGERAARIRRTAHALIG